MDIRIDHKYDYFILMYDNVKGTGKYITRNREGGAMLLSKISKLMNQDVISFYIGLDEICINIYDWLENIDISYIIRVMRCY